MEDAVTYEEEGRNESDWYNGLAGSELRRSSNAAVVHALSSSLLSDDFDGRRAATLLLMDLIEGRLLGAVEAEELHHLERYGPKMVKQSEQ